LRESKDLDSFRVPFSCHPERSESASGVEGSHAALFLRRVFCLQFNGKDHHGRIDSGRVILRLAQDDQEGTLTLCPPSPRPHRMRARAIEKTRKRERGADASGSGSAALPSERALGESKDLDSFRVPCSCHPERSESASGVEGSRAAPFFAPRDLPAVQRKDHHGRADSGREILRISSLAQDDREGTLTLSPSEPSPASYAGEGMGEGPSLRAVRFWGAHVFRRSPLCRPFAIGSFGLCVSLQR